MELAGAFGGLGVLWNPLNIQCKVLMEKQNWLAVNCRILSQNRFLIVVNVYRPIATSAKRELWLEIGAWLQLQEGSQVIIRGYFIATLSNIEKLGGSQTLSRIQLGFQAFVEDGRLREVQTKNGKYIGQIREKVTLTLQKN